MTDREWMARAECVHWDSEVFFPDPKDRQAQNLAKTICADCPVTTQCDQYAKDTHSAYGIWGGRFRNERNFTSTPMRPTAHGSKAGYDAHRRRGEQPCNPCERAKLLYNAHQYQLRKAKRG